MNVRGDVLGSPHTCSTDTTALMRKSMTLACEYSRPDSFYIPIKLTEIKHLIVHYCLHIARSQVHIA